jgi:hypothetical protein
MLRPLKRYKFLAFAYLLVAALASLSSAARISGTVVQSIGRPEASRSAKPDLLADAWVETPKPPRWPDAYMASCTGLIRRSMIQRDGRRRSRRGGGHAGLPSLKTAQFSVCPALPHD